jgi:hypothetical protein
MVAWWHGGMVAWWHDEVEDPVMMLWKLRPTEGFLGVSFVADSSLLQ